MTLSKKPLYSGGECLQFAAKARFLSLIGFRFLRPQSRLITGLGELEHKKQQALHWISMDRFDSINCIWNQVQSKVLTTQHSSKDCTILPSQCITPGELNALEMSY